MKVTSILHSKEIFEIEPISTGNLHLEGAALGAEPDVLGRPRSVTSITSALRASSCALPELQPSLRHLCLQELHSCPCKSKSLWEICSGGKKKKELYLHQGGSWGQVPGKFMLTSERPGPIRDYFSPSCSWSKN